MSKIWKESGYHDFADGTFGNAGQNLYLSRAGVLQRIFHFDFNKNGFIDLFFVNSQDMGERVPAYVIQNALDKPKTTQLPTNGGYAATVADLNGDGYDELIITNQHSGVHSDLTAFIYYGSPEGMSERYKLELPAPNCRAVAAGDFNNNGRIDLAFACEGTSKGKNGKLRIFYQTPSGFLPGDFTDFDLEVTHMVAKDIDGDGCAELYVRIRKDIPRVLWGSKNGIDINNFSLIGDEEEDAKIEESSTPGWELFSEGWTPRILNINGEICLFRSQNNQVFLFPITQDRIIGKPYVINCPYAVSAAAGDINGDGQVDLVIAVCQDRNEITSSWIYWGSHQFSNSNRTALSTRSTRDIVLSDLNGNRKLDIIVCQGRTDTMNTTESLIFTNTEKGLDPEPQKVTTHDAGAALVARTCDDKNPQLIFINHVDGRFCGDVPAYVYYGGPNGFSVKNRAELPGWSAPAAAACDFNDNGWADILLCNCAENAPHIDPGSFLYWGGPSGYEPQNKLVLPVNRAHGCAVGDFRRCGYLDIIFGSFRCPQLTLFNGGPKGFDLQNPQRILLDKDATDYIPTKDFKIYENLNPEYSETRWLFAADFNNNGWLDLFVSQIAGPRSLILWGGPEGFSMDRCIWLNVEGASCARAADLTGNGWLDLIVGGHQAQSKKWRYESYIYIYWGGPNGFSQDRRCQLPAHTCNSLAIADLNNNGILDILATSYNNGRERDCDSFIYWGSAGGHFSAANRTRLFTHSACGCLAADFNEDGWIDVAIANHKTYGNHVGFSQIFWNGPNGFSEKSTTELPTLGPHGMLSMDPGNIMDRGPEEYYISSPFQLPAQSKVRTIRWVAELPPKTWVKAQIRYASNRSILEQSPWQGPNGADSWFENNEPVPQTKQTGPWIQYRLCLGSKNSGCTPRVTSVEVEYD